MIWHNERPQPLCLVTAHAFVFAPDIRAINSTGGRGGGARAGGAWPLPQQQQQQLQASAAVSAVKICHRRVSLNVIKKRNRWSLYKVIKHKKSDTTANKENICCPAQLFFSNRVK